MDLEKNKVISQATAEAFVRFLAFPFRDSLVLPQIRSVGRRCSLLHISEAQQRHRRNVPRSDQTFVEPIVVCCVSYDEAGMIQNAASSSSSSRRTGGIVISDEAPKKPDDGGCC